MNLILYPETLGVGSISMLLFLLEKGVSISKTVS